MSCYHPNTLVYDLNPATGELTSFFSRVPFFGFSEKEKSRHFRVAPIPCGHCIGCNLDRSRSWADRMLLELDHSSKAMFVTLTYNDNHLPLVEVDDSLDGYRLVPTLRKYDVQLFMKRLRKQFSDRDLRYYLCGEYGSRFHRPHYHIVLFGLQLSDFPDRHIVSYNEFRQPYFSSPFFERIWGNGFIGLSQFSWQTAAYVARYVQKKSFGMTDENPDVSHSQVQPEFALMSRRPGIGGYFHIDHPDFDMSSLFVLGDPNGVLPSSREIRLPRYVLDKFADLDPEFYATFLQDRQKFASDRLLLELQNTDLDAMMYLKSKETDHLSKAKRLLRK